MKIGQEARQEHLDPANAPSSEEDKLKHIQTRFGTSLTVTKLAEAEKVMNDVIPGFAYVQQAHKIVRGTETTNDIEMVAKLYANAAALGNADGIYSLGLFYKDGRGVKQDLRMYIKLMREAASKPHKLPRTMCTNVGVAEAEHSLGLAYEEGVGVNQDATIAFQWYKKSSDHGCSNASNNLGFLYMSGRGVPLSIERGVQYWKLAANQGNQLAMRSLALHYLEIEKDPREAQEWYDRAVKHGNLEAQLNRADFEAQVKELEKKNEKVEDQLIEFEKESSLSGKGMTLKSRMKRMMRAIFPDMTDTMNGVESIYLAGKEKGSTPNSAPRQFDPAVLAKYARNGSKTAIQILTSMSHFDNVCKLLMESDLEKNTVQIIQELSECLRLCELVVQLPPHFRDKLCDIVKSALKSGTTSELDRNARACFMLLQMDNLEHMLIFTERSRQKYPDEKAFHIHYGSICGFLGKFEVGAREMRKSLETFPNDIELLYYKAVHLRLIETRQRDGLIKAYEEFLSVAPPDHRKVPESYYAISNEYFGLYGMKSQAINGGKKKNVKPSALDQNKLKGLINKMEEYHQLGLEAEKIQLPCFLPYESSQKAMVENRQVLMPLMKSEFSQANNRGHSSNVKTPMVPQVKSTDQSQIGSDLNYIKLSDPNRIQVIKSHRESLLERRRMQDKTKINPHTATPANSQRAPVQLVGLKPITFLEMDTLVDRVYEGRVIQVTSVDDAGFGIFPSIRLALEDENGNLLRAFIYNFPETDEKIVQQKLGFGAKMSILNPYMRLAQDGHFGIRVDDVTSLFLHTPATTTSCRFCSLEKADLHCGRCKWANYCSKKCQELDWKLMKHKLICVPL